MTAAQRLPRSDHCVFTDSAGVQWSVSEKLRENPSGSGFAMVLVFESQTAFRCVRHYPENWLDLDRLALETLSWKS
jgi:hypothetical protein